MYFIVLNYLCFLTNHVSVRNGMSYRNKTLLTNVSLIVRIVHNVNELEHWMSKREHSGQH